MTAGGEGSLSTRGPGGAEGALGLGQAGQQLRKCNDSGSATLSDVGHVDDDDRAAAVVDEQHPSPDQRRA